MGAFFLYLLEKTKFADGRFTMLNTDACRFNYQLVADGSKCKYKEWANMKRKHSFMRPYDFRSWSGYVLC